MARWLWLLTALGLLGCGGDRTTPVWAVDPIFLEPTQGGIYGLQSWELFAEAWTRAYRRRYYVCGVVVELDGTATTSECTECEQAWTITAQFVETDCEGTIGEDERFLFLTELAFGPVDATLDPDDPHPGSSTGVLADYGGGLEDYGWGYPEALDNNAELNNTSWDGERSFTLAPSFVWELGQ